MFTRWVLAYASLRRHGARRRSGCGLQPGNATWGVALATLGVAQAALVFPRLARPALGRRLRIQAQVGQGLLDDRPLDDGGDDPAPATAAAAIGTDDRIAVDRHAHAGVPGCEAFDHPGREYGRSADEFPGTRRRPTIAGTVAQ